jgi:hypothetical protein
MGSFDEFIDDIARSFENRHDQAVEGFPSHTLCRYTSLISTLSTTIQDLVEDGLCIFPGTTEMLNFNAGLLNCIVDCQPAVVCKDGHLEYWKDGVPHAEGGPAVVSLHDQILEYWYNGHHILHSINAAGRGHSLHPVAFERTVFSGIVISSLSWRMSESYL